MSNWFIIFIFIIYAYGFSNMMVFGSGPFRIFEHVRRITSNISEHFGSMFQCMMCFPANLGWVSSLIDWFALKGIAITPFNILLIGTNLWWVALIGDCVFTSGVVWLLHNFESFFESIAGGESIVNTTGSNEEQNDNNVINIHD